MPATPSPSEDPTMPTPLPPFRPHHVRLVGHRDLGIVPARYVGCWLEIDHPEHGGRYGPSAVFRVEPVVEPVAEAKASRGALVWVHAHDAWNLCHPSSMYYPDAPYTAYPWGAFSYSRCNAMRDRADRFQEHRKNDTPVAITQITTWAREDGYEVPPWPGEDAAPVAQPEPVPVGAWGGHTDWIAWGGGECPVPAKTKVQIKTRDGDPSPASLAGVWWWGRHDRSVPHECIAYRIVKPAPKDRTVYDPNDVQRGDRHILSDGTRGTVLGVIDGWIAYTDRLPEVQHSTVVVRVEPVISC